MDERILKLKNMTGRAMRHWVYFLYELSLEKNINEVLELGVLQAQSTRAILCGFNEKRSGMLTSIDWRDRSRVIVDEDLKVYWRFIMGDMHNEGTIKKVSDRKYDLMLCDIVLDYNDIKKSFYKYFDLIKTDGIMLLHNVLPPHFEGISKFFKEINYPKIILPYGVAGMGIIQKL